MRKKNKTYGVSWKGWALSTAVGVVLFLTMSNVMNVRFAAADTTPGEADQYASAEDALMGQASVRTSSQMSRDDLDWVLSK